MGAGVPGSKASWALHSSFVNILKRDELIMHLCVPSGPHLMGWLTKGGSAMRACPPHHSDRRCRTQAPVTLQLKLSSPKGSACHSSAQKPLVALSCLLNINQVCPLRFSMIPFEVYCLLLVTEQTRGYESLCHCGFFAAARELESWLSVPEFGEEARNYLFKSYTGLEE